MQQEPKRHRVQRENGSVSSAKSSARHPNVYPPRYVQQQQKQLPNIPIQRENGSFSSMKSPSLSFGSNKSSLSSSSSLMTANTILQQKQLWERRKKNWSRFLLEKITMLFRKQFTTV